MEIRPPSLLARVCVGYLQIYHVLLCIMRKNPELRKRALLRLKGFRKEEASRPKAATLDSGELLVVAVVAGSYNPKLSPKIPKRSRRGFSEIVPVVEARAKWLGRRLREAVVKSEERKYHLPLVQGRINQLVTRRRDWTGVILGERYSYRGGF